MQIINNDKYELIEKRRIEDLNSEGYILKHKKTGARIVLLSNDDENKVFHIAFRTPPTDDTGVAHIVEHSTLCGSRKYPVKDPFVELCKGSLNTFLNAMTYPDKTIYPVASCNDADFKIIMDVYLDSVFHPAIYEHDEIFRQEGWHYEATAVDEPITYNGVVYNEMKGAFSDPDDVLNSCIFSTLFPDNAYGKESGGAPQAIPTLTYEDFLRFHSKYYHPSNSYIYLYGNMDMNERLEYLDREYLSEYEYLQVDSAIEEQKAFDKPVHVCKEYSVTEEDGVEDNALLSYNVVVDNVLDSELYMAFQIIEYALIDAPGAPLKKALINAGIGTEVYGSYENSVYQPVFSIVSRNADEAKAEEFETIIKEVLQDTVTNGINKKAFYAGINKFEFKYKEADFGSYPRGLILGLQAMDSWLYDDNRPFIHIESSKTFEKIKSHVEDGYFEKLIEKYLLNNNHAAYVTLTPVINYNEKMDKETEDKLAKYKESLSTGQIEEIIKATDDLKKYQDEPSPQEDLEKIPMLTRNDLNREISPVYIDERNIAGTTAVFSEVFTSGIAYIKLDFDCKYVEDELIPYLGILAYTLNSIDTKQREYFELVNDINIHTGGISHGVTVYTNDQDKSKYRICTEVSLKALYNKVPDAMSLLKEIIFESKLDDYARLKEIIAQLKSQVQSRIIGGGHVAAINQSMSEFSETLYYVNQYSGVAFYKFLCDLDENYEAMKEEISSKLFRLIEVIYNKDNLIISITADKSGYEACEAPLADFINILNTNTAAAVAVRRFKPTNIKTAYTTASQVNYVARTGNYINKGYKYTGALKVLKTIFSYEYLWLNVRVKGGAYGCMSSFSRTGDSYMVSYRDPKIGQTNEIYEKAYEFVKNFDVSERDMTKYIIGTIGGMDTPMTPRSKGSYSFAIYMSDSKLEDIKRDREQVIDATVQDIRNLWEIVKAVIEDNHLCVIGSGEAIKNEADLFDEIRSL